MGLEFNKEELEKQGAFLEKAAEDNLLVVDNLKWETTLSTAELMMVKDAMNNYKLNASGLKEEEFKRYVDISKKYAEIKNFYSRINEVKYQLNAGIISKEDLPFDIDLTIGEACAKYTDFDRATAEGVDAMLYEVNRKTQLYEKDIREHCNGNLAAYLGYNKEEYEVKAGKFEESLHGLKETLDNLYAPTPEQLERMRNVINNYAAVASQTAQNYAASEVAPPDNQIDEAPKGFSM